MSTPQRPRTLPGYINNHEDRLYNLERRFDGETTGRRSRPGSRPYATFVVAASDSTAPGAAAADYVCSGTGDETTIQAAVDALGSNGGCVLLLEGTYNIAANAGVFPFQQDQLTIAGMGAGTVLVSGSSQTTPIYVESCYRPTVRDLTIKGTAAGGPGHLLLSLVTCEAPSVLNVWIGDDTDSADTGGVLVDTCAQAVIHGCHVYGVTATGRPAFYVDSTEHSVIALNTIEVCDIGVQMAGTNTGTLFTNNTLATVTTGISGTVEVGAGNFINGVWTT